MTQNESNHAPDAARETNGTRTRLALVAFWFLALVAYWGALYGDFIFEGQENSFFIFRTEFLTKWLDEPAGLLCWFTAFLMQFFYYPYLGAVILASLGVALAEATARLLRLKGAWLATAILPTLALSAALTRHAFYIYLPMNTTLVFANYVGATLAVWLALGVRSVPFPKAKTVLFAALLVFGWAALGAWGALASLLVAVSAGEMAPVKLRALRYLLFPILALAAPYVVRYFCYFTVLPVRSVFFAGVLDDALGAHNSGSAIQFVSGSVIAGAFVFLGAALSPLFVALADLRARNAAKAAKSAKKDASRKASRPEKRAGKKTKLASEAAADTPAAGDLETDALPKKKSSGARLVWELTVVFGAVAFLCSYRVSPFFQVLAQNRALNVGDWDRILELDAKTPRPIEHSVALRNIAYFERGELGERAFERLIAGLNVVDYTMADLVLASRSNSRALARINRYKSKRAVQDGALSSCSETILWRYGQSSVAARAGMNKLSGSGGRSLAAYRTLAICAMCGGEKDLATRYLRQMRETLFYRKWAEAAQEFVDSARFKEGVRDFYRDKAYEEKLRAQEPEIVDSKPLSPKALEIADAIIAAREIRPVEDGRLFDSFPDLARIYGVFDDDFEKAPPRVREAEIVASLFQRGDLNDPGDGFFMKNIESYIASCPNGRLPKGIEQGYATLLWERDPKEWNKGTYKFSPETLSAFGEFADFAVRQGGNIDSVDSQEAIRQCCEGTYWGYAEDRSAFIRY